MIHKTKALVLKSVKYGESSLIVTLLTELFGQQSYMANGVRTEKKGGSKAGMYQPGSLLNLEVYHQENKSLHRIKEASYSRLFHGNSSHALKNSIVFFMMELVHKCLKHPEPNEALFQFLETSLEQLDQSEGKAIAIFPFFFALKLPQMLGFGIEAVHLTEKEMYLDLENGIFTHQLPGHKNFLSGLEAAAAGELLKDKADRKSFVLPAPAKALQTFIPFYSIHVSDFGQMRSLTFLLEMLS